MPRFTIAVSDETGTVLFSEQYNCVSPRQAAKLLAQDFRLSNVSKKALEPGYRWADADEVEWHLNVAEIPDAIWVNRVTNGDEWADLSVPEGTFI